jgi:hypothetical protein
MGMGEFEISRGYGILSIKMTMMKKERNLFKGCYDGTNMKSTCNCKSLESFSFFIFFIISLT